MYVLALCLIFCLGLSHAMQGTKKLADAQQTEWEKYKAKNNSVIFWKLHPALANETEKGRGNCEIVEMNNTLARGYLKSCRPWPYNKYLGICDLPCGGKVIIMCWQKKNWYPLNDVPFCSETAEAPSPEQSCRVPLPEERICTSASSSAQQLVPLHSTIPCLCSNNCRQVTLTCTAGGEWSGSSQCNESYLDEALTVDVNETSLFFSCAENHRLVGQNCSTCRDGVLSHAKPVCEAVSDFDLTRLLLLYCLPVVLILLCLCVVSLVFALRRRKSTRLQRSPAQRTPRGYDNGLVQVHRAAMRPDTSHYEEMNVMCASVVYDEILCNAATLPCPEYANRRNHLTYPNPEYVNSPEQYLSPIVNRRVLMIHQ